jgi:hypothetical protein
MFFVSSKVTEIVPIFRLKFMTFGLFFSNSFRMMHAVPNTGWPANGTSLFGVNILTW